SVTQIIAEIGEHKSFDEILQNLHKLPDTINRTYIDQSSYWLTFFPLRGFLVIFDLAQILNLAWIFIKTRLFGRTPRDHREYTQPQDFEYAIYYSNIMFMGTVGLVFAPLAPLVAVAAAIVLWISSWVYKYQLMFVFVSRVESGGRLWNPVINRLLFSLLMMQALMVLTIGLQYGWKSFAWVATVPPFVIVLLFKGYINRVFDKPFRYYVPTEEELREAKIHSQRGDLKGNRLEKRFGHPALHQELFTPMLHASMMPLLAEVYHGKLNHEQTKMGEYDGQKMDSQVVPGGLRIAAIAQNELEYDPRMYQRDRGELDWDQRSMATTAYMSDAGSAYPSKPGMFRGILGSEIELSRFDGPYNDQAPLLPPPGFVGPNQSMSSLPSYHNSPQQAYSSPQNTYTSPQQSYTSPQQTYNSPQQTYNSPQFESPQAQYPPPGAGMGMAPVYHAQSQGDYRQAPTHRPPPSRQGSAFTYAGSAEGPGEMNMAGRGTFRG
ncbi:hypothetical protein OF83DRAFT_1176076, partial [Amylostereum chailletii]